RHGRAEADLDAADGHARGGRLRRGRAAGEQAGGERQGGKGHVTHGKEGSPRPTRCNPWASVAHGFSASSHTQGAWPQPGQPPPYLARTAAVRSTPTPLASVASQASTSANSRARSRLLPPRSALASSPTSCMNHMNVPSTPRRA